MLSAVYGYSFFNNNLTIKEFEMFIFTPFLFKYVIVSFACRLKELTLLRVCQLMMRL